MCRDPEVEGESSGLKEAREAGMVSMVSMRESSRRPEGLYRCTHGPADSARLCGHD